MEEHLYALQVGITRTKEFERKELATHAVNVGLKCGHECRYCSSPALLRCHPAFRKLSKSSFENGYAIVDPETVKRIERDVHRLEPEHVMMLCTTTDAWAPEARRFGLGPGCLRVLLQQSQATVRVLTKNRAVADSFEIMAQHRDRVTLSLSITAPPSHEHVMRVLEPNASSISERLDALKEAHRLGLRTYGMLCPCLPGIANQPEQLGEMFERVVACEAEDIWLEPVNPRGRALILCAEALAKAGFAREAEAINTVRRRHRWRQYAVRLVQNAQKVAERFGVLDRLHVLLYQGQFSPEDFDTLSRRPEGIIWLGKALPRSLREVSR